MENIKEEKIVSNLKRCPRFGRCSANVCPICLREDLITKLAGEENCPFLTKKRGKHQKGMKLLAPDSVLEVIPESNVKMLNKHNLKRWHGLQKDGK
jgi:hypothetical protein